MSSSPNDPHGLLSTPLPQGGLTTYDEDLPYDAINISGSPPVKRKIFPEIITTWTRLLASSPGGSSFVKATADSGLSVCPNASSPVKTASFVNKGLFPAGITTINIGKPKINQLYGMTTNGWLQLAAAGPASILLDLLDVNNEIEIFTRSMSVFGKPYGAVFIGDILDNWMSPVAISVPIDPETGAIYLSVTVGGNITAATISGSIYYE